MGLRIGEFPEEENVFLTTPLVAESAFDSEDIKRVLEIIDNENLPKKRLGSFNFNDRTESAKLTMSFIPYIDENAWVYGKMYDLAKTVNDDTYKFSDVEMFEHIVYIEVLENDYVNMHLDIGVEHPHNSRKITAIVNLNPSDDYRGGQFNVISNEKVTLSRTQGDVTFFPSFLENEITYVHSGVRKILVAWFGGNSFK